jgi:type I restriction enzyme S subunit
MLEPDDIIFQTVRPYQQNNYFYDNVRDLPSIASTGYAVIRTKQAPKFIYSLIHTHRFLTPVMQRCTGSSYPAITGSDLEDIPIWIPCLKEQKQIGSLLDLINKRIDAQSQLIEHLKKYKRGVSEQLFEQIKSKSTQLPFSSVFVLLQNNTFSRDLLTNDETAIQNIHYGDVLIKFGSCVNIDKDEVPYIKNSAPVDKFESESYLVSGDIVIADTAEDYTVGKATEIINSCNKKILSGLHTIPCRPTMTFAPMFMGYYLNSSAFRNQIMPLIQGTKVSSIGKTQLMKTMVYIPPIDEQKRIADLLHSIDTKINLLSATVEKMKQLKAAMLQQLFI